ncbi:amidohydrolase [Komagataeibacter sucrofermentans]|uniref:Amidohydrolase n=1 Tax=Komagataeibacter sucrofermentans TaxID=1053551 RepID=A0A318QZ64_9PROT|nr:amidohydrolase [Komagataeibacter sucrofermentans]PYD80629.1 amidohydrolase [Komagataeibacter sucrofermentans]GBQ50648.1 amidohydrolase [Komagataeibacter sucrofermentans DSM 15973]
MTRAACLTELTALRQDLHAHPELRFEEVRTADLVYEYLTEIGYAPVRGLATTGVVATLHGNRPGPSIILRADMDALPVHERGTHGHVSRHAGRMHACGHDGHTVMLLGAAARLAARPPEHGVIHFVFQPGEEGGAGARVMIEEGLFTRFPAEACFGLHNWPGLPAGQLAVRNGPIMAGGWRFRIRIRGRGAHAAQPHLSADPVLAGAALVQAMQQLVARRTNPLVPAVVSVCTFHAGSTDNIIPDQAELAGTIRALDRDTLERLREELVDLAAGMAQAGGVEMAVDYHSPYPVTVNAAAPTRIVGHVMRDMDADTAWPPADTDVPPSLASEDFGFMLEQRPGTYAMIGNGPSAALHAPDYDFNDNVIGRGVTYWERLARYYLAQQTRRDEVS